MRRREREGTQLRTEDLAYRALADLRGPDAAPALARLVLAVFDDLHARVERIPAEARAAFEARDWPRAAALAAERLALYGEAVADAASILGPAIRAEAGRPGFWAEVERAHERLVAARYERDLAAAFLASLRRAIEPDLWVPMRQDFERGRGGARPFLLTLPAAGRMTPDLAAACLAAPGLAVPFRDLAGDAAAVAERINAELGLSDQLSAVEVVQAGFFRNRGAYVFGRLRLAGGDRPLGLALLHEAEGVVVDAVLLRETTLRHVFSTSLANFQVEVADYHELVDFLAEIMPGNPRAMHYATIGYNHVGKIAVLRGLTGTAERLDHAPGPRGSVAIAFTSAGRDFVAKVMRDRPTAGYKWASYGGPETVLAKYRRVHELNRAGAMLDNVIYAKLALPRALFAPALLDEIMEAAASSVSLLREDVIFDHLVVQRKVTPLPVYLETCDRRSAEFVTMRLGQCIRNNAASNVLNRDLDGRNYGVSALRFVYLFDYDAIETLTEVTVRPFDREEGEEDLPAWFWEEGPVFVPEELEAHLRLPDRGLRRLFRERHGDLLRAEWWLGMQARLRRGEVPGLRIYPRAARLPHRAAEGPEEA